MSYGISIVDSDALTLYALVRRVTDNLHWQSGTTFAALTTGNLASQAQSLTATVISAGAKARYDSALTGLPLGEYDINIYQQAGGSPSLSADGLPRWMLGVQDWTGTRFGTNVLMVDDLLAALVTLTGTGTNPCTLTITDGGVPIANASVWVTADAAGKTIVAGPLTTSALGQVRVLLNAGTTYFLWMSAPGQNPIVGQAFQAIAD